ncbi:hypothetical protein M2101_002310 [Parabacteroides sp. PM5-20]|nr:hypothetical protein [Parabacteroides sp. PM5-20]
MIYHIPTKSIFKNRKGAKIHFGTSKYLKMEKDKRDIIFINSNSSATNELQKNNRKDS